MGTTRKSDKKEKVKLPSYDQLAQPRKQRQAKLKGRCTGTGEGDPKIRGWPLWTIRADGSCSQEW